MLWIPGIALWKGLGFLRAPLESQTTGTQTNNFALVDLLFLPKKIHSVSVPWTSNCAVSGLNIPEAHMKIYLCKTFHLRVGPKVIDWCCSSPLGLYIHTYKFVHLWNGTNVCIRFYFIMNWFKFYPSIIVSSILSMYADYVYIYISIYLSINPSTDPSKIHGCLLISSNAFHVFLRCIHWLSDHLLFIALPWDQAIESENELLREPTQWTEYF